MEQATSSLDLIARIKQGDREAFAPLFEKHRPRLAILIHYKMGAALRNAYDVDDILQETLLQAYRRIESFDYRSSGSFFRWIARIAEHAVIDAARYEGRDKRDAGRRIPFRTESHPSGVDPADSVTPSRLLRNNEAVKSLMKMMDLLPEHYRQAVLLAKVEGLSTQEMADRMGRTREAAILILHRALKQLRRLQEGGEGQ